MLRLVKKFWNDWSNGVMAVKMLGGVLVLLSLATLSALANNSNYDLVIELALELFSLTCTATIMFWGIYVIDENWRWRRDHGHRNIFPPDDRNDQKRLMQDAMREVDDYLSGEFLKREIEKLAIKAKAIICPALLRRAVLFLTIG